MTRYQLLAPCLH